MRSATLNTCTKTMAHTCSAGERAMRGYGASGVAVTPLPNVVPAHVLQASPADEPSCGLPAGVRCWRVWVPLPVLAHSCAWPAWILQHAIQVMCNKHMCHLSVANAHKDTRQQLAPNLTSHRKPRGASCAEHRVSRFVNCNEFTQLGRALATEPRNTA